MILGIPPLVVETATFDISLLVLLKLDEGAACINKTEQVLRYKQSPRVPLERNIDSSVLASCRTVLTLPLVSLPSVNLTIEINGEINRCHGFKHGRQGIIALLTNFPKGRILKVLISFLILLLLGASGHHGWVPGPCPRQSAE